jgi:hypothetical protein
MFVDAPHRRRPGTFLVKAPGGTRGQTRSREMAERPDSRRRWDTDAQFTGVADASVFAANVEELAGLVRRPGWVAGNPEPHLVPLLRDGAAGLRLTEYRAGGHGVLDVAAEHSPEDSLRDIRRAWALIGTIATASVSVQEPGENRTEQVGAPGDLHVGGVGQHGEL